MSIKKRLMAAILAVIMVICTAVPAFAATSSGSSAPETQPANPGFVVKVNLDNNLQDHSREVLVRSRVTSTAAVVHDVTHTPGNKPTSFVALSIARDKDNKKRAITHVGNAKKGAFDSAKGRCVKSVTIGSTAAKLTVSTKAFYKSNVNILRFKSQKVIIRANAFKGTNNTAMKIYIIPPKKTAANYSFASGAFNGLSTKSVISVSASAMTVTEFNKLKKKLVKAGYKGKIVRK